MAASIEENSYNLHYMPEPVKNDRSFVLSLIKKDKLFKEDLFALVNDYGNHREDYELVKQCIKKHPDLYGRFFKFKEDYEIIHIYIEAMKNQTNGVYSLAQIPQNIKAQASMNKTPLDKFVLNKVLEKRLLDSETSERVKVKKTKI